MKRIFIVIGAIALVLVGVLGDQLFTKASKPTLTITSTSIQEQLVGCSELTTAKLNYRGLVRYEDGDIDFLTKKGFTMVYDAEARAGVDLSLATVEVGTKEITVVLPKAVLQGITVNPNTIEFYDESFALFNWENKKDTAEALKAAEADAKGKVDQVSLIDEADSQAYVVVESLLKPLTEGDGAYTLKIIRQS